jgi:type I restriction enzyme, S subunit
VALPPLPEQKYIASILKAYDDLIEVNRQRIALLEEMAQRLFEEWFVRFRFPGHKGHRMVDTPDGQLPEGWQRQRIGDLTSFLSRGITPQYDETATTLVVGQKCIRGQRLSLGPARKQSRVVPREKLVQPGDVLINSTGVGTLGRVAQADAVTEGLTVDTHVTIVRPRPDIDRHFFGLALLRLEPVFEHLGAGATGQTELGRTRIADTKLVKPSSELQIAFGRHARPVRELAFRLTQQIDVLAHARDLLLPRLISGEVKISTAPRELETAA